MRSSQAPCALRRPRGGPRRLADRRDRRLAEHPDHRPEGDDRHRSERDAVVAAPEVDARERRDPRRHARDSQSGVVDARRQQRDEPGELGAGDELRIREHEVPQSTESAVGAVGDRGPSAQGRDQQHAGLEEDEPREDAEEHRPQPGREESGRLLEHRLDGVLVAGVLLGRAAEGIPCVFAVGAHPLDAPDEVVADRRAVDRLRHHHPTDVLAEESFERAQPVGGGEEGVGRDDRGSGAGDEQLPADVGRDARIVAGPGHDDATIRSRMRRTSSSTASAASVRPARRSCTNARAASAAVPPPLIRDEGTRRDRRLPQAVDDRDEQRVLPLVGGAGRGGIHEGDGHGVILGRVGCDRGSVDDRSATPAQVGGCGGLVSAG